MRLLFVTGSLHRGGAERHAALLLNGLADRGHDCVAVYVQDGGGELRDLGLRDSIAVHRLRATGYFDLRAVRRLAALIARIRPAALVATNPYALMYATLARGRSPCRLVTTYHSTRLLGLKQRLQMLAYRPLFWSADCTIFVCAAQHAYCRHRAIVSRRSEVIHNGIDVDGLFAPRALPESAERRRALGFADSDFVIGISAWLRPEKNHVQLVDAIARLRAAGIPARALMVGEGEMRETILAHARALEVAEHVLVTGARRDIRMDIAACNVVAICSVAVETFSLAALEAMALEKPVVHSNLGGAGEMIFDGYNGFLFPVGDTAALVARLAMLADSSLAERMGRNARLVVRALFSAETMVGCYERLLQGLCRPDPSVAPIAAAGADTQPTPAPGKPRVLLLGPDRRAVSGVSTHLNMLLGSRLTDSFDLLHLKVGSEGRRGGRLGGVLRLLASPFALATAICRHRPAVVHINTSLVAGAFWRDLVYLVAARLLGRRVVYQVHGGALPQDFLGRGGLQKVLLCRALRLPDRIVVLARSELEAYRALLPGRSVSAIPNAIDAEANADLKRSPPNPGAPLKVLYLGRIVAAKGVHELLRGLAQARAQGVDALLSIAGEGPEEASLRELVAELGLGAEVHFTGPVFGADKLRLLAGADVFALPTYHVEGLPYALLEAMAAGVAVITTRVAAIPDVVTDGVHGVLVPPRDPAAIAAALGTLFADRDRLTRMGLACRRRIDESYSLPRLAADFHELYSTLCARPHRRGSQHTEQIES